jgi:hypothetical protein
MQPRDIADDRRSRAHRGMRLSRAGRAPVRLIEKSDRGGTWGWCDYRELRLPSRRSMSALVRRVSKMNSSAGAARKRVEDQAPRQRMECRADKCPATRSPQ